MLINGKWQGRWHPFQQMDSKAANTQQGDSGRFERQSSGFRNWVTRDGTAGPTGDAGYRAEAGRFHLYAALICPWACRTLAALELLGLKDVISVSIVAPALSDEGWAFGGFPDATQDHLNGAAHMHEIYTKSDESYTGRATVPVLWDKQTERIVNNESADILRMLSTGFGHLGSGGVDLYPEAHQAEIDALAPWLYDKLNNGVYRAGFARSQAAYGEAVADVFCALDTLEARLSDGRNYLVGDRVAEADIRLFVTLARFDAAYYGLFKCNRRRIADYPALRAYTARIHALPGVENTVNIDHIKAGYYSIKALNPNGIIPSGPARPW
jgi:putative glutathione S-transferase